MPENFSGRLAALVLLGLVACAGGTPTPDPAGAGVEKLIECEDPRPQICTREYRPVCALRDTGIRCVTVPCDSNEWQRYGNACSACADDRVYGYMPQDCEQAGGTGTP